MLSGVMILLIIGRYDNSKSIFKLHIALLTFLCYTLSIPAKEAYQHERQGIMQANRQQGKTAEG